MNSTPLSFNQLLDNIITQIINPLIMLIAAAAFILFLYEVYQLIRNAGGDTGLADAKRGILWSFIGLVIIFGVYGILNIVTSTFNLKRVTPITNTTKTTNTNPSVPRDIIHYFSKYDTNYNIKGYINRKPATKKSGGTTQSAPNYIYKSSTNPAPTDTIHLISNYFSTSGTK